MHTSFSSGVIATKTRAWQQGECCVFHQLVERMTSRVYLHWRCCCPHSLSIHTRLHPHHQQYHVPSIERLPEYSHMLRSVGIYVFSDVCTWHETRVRAVVPISIYLLWEIHWIFLLHLLAITMYGKNSYLFILVWT